jgi:hypothetical protein
MRSDCCWAKRRQSIFNDWRRQEVDEKTLLWVVNKTPKGVKAWKCMKFIFSMNIMDFSVSAILPSRFFPNMYIFAWAVVCQNGNLLPCLPLHDEFNAKLMVNLFL